MQVEVVLALPRRVQHVVVHLPAGATLRDALVASGLDLQIQNHTYGIFGKRAELDQPLAEGDRVEIYRPLTMDPKEARRLRARKKKS
jgi:putative ubiquitin-RnfH superfamily antitoxin RatB of RatAB toxin-antitoxin module